VWRSQRPACDHPFQLEITVFKPTSGFIEIMFPHPPFLRIVAPVPRARSAVFTPSSCKSCGQALRRLPLRCALARCPDSTSSTRTAFGVFASLFFPACRRKVVIARKLGPFPRGSARVWRCRGCRFRRRWPHATARQKRFFAQIARGEELQRTAFTTAKGVINRRACLFFFASSAGGHR